jgi:hypothetical protein
MSPLFLLGRSLEFPNWELFTPYSGRNDKCRKTIHIPSIGEWNGLLQWCLKASKRKEDSKGRILVA